MDLEEALRNLLRGSGLGDAGLFAVALLALCCLMLKQGYCCVRIVGSEVLVLR